MSVLYSPTLNYSSGDRRRNPEMDSNIGNLQLNCNKLNSGLLLRYRSAPSSLQESLVDTSSHGCVNEEGFRGEDDQHRYLPSSSSPEMETLLAKLVSSNTGWINSASCLPEFGGKPVKQEKAGESVSNSYGSPQLIYQSQQIPGFPNGSLGSGNGFDGTFSAVNSMVSENSSQSKMVPRNSSNLIRQKSSPAGLFNNSPVQNGFAGWREMGSFRACDVSNGQASTSTSGLNGTLTFSSRPSSCSSQLPDIAENGNESCVESARNLGNDNGTTTNCYMPSFRSDFWDGASAFNDQKPANDNDQIMFSTSDAFETQNADFGYQKLGLAHHLSLPSSSSKMGAMEKLLQIQESVPCKTRAKRGFATHPRSIAERVRRTKISERIKKLQELFPKSDKQTSTADMLDLAVDYIKDLQSQVKILTDTKAKCKCSSNQKQN